MHNPSHRPHVCSDCGRRFSTAAKLQEHGHFHSGGRPYQCDLCDFASHASSGLARHKTSKHGAAWAEEAKRLELTTRSILESEGIPPLLEVGPPQGL